VRLVSLKTAVRGLEVLWPLGRTRQFDCGHADGRFRRSAAWLTTRRMGEDAPYLSFAIPVRAQLGGQRAFQICVALKPSAENRPSHIGGENRGERRVVSGLDRAAYVFFVDG